MYDPWIQILEMHLHLKDREKKLLITEMILI